MGEGSSRELQEPVSMSNQSPPKLQAPKAAPVQAIDTRTNQQAAAGEAWESPREYANDYWKSPTCPFDVSDLLGDEAGSVPWVMSVKHRAKAHQPGKSQFR